MRAAIRSTARRSAGDEEESEVEAEMIDRSPMPLTDVALDIALTTPASSASAAAQVSRSTLNTVSVLAERRAESPRVYDQLVEI